MGGSPTKKRQSPAARLDEIGIDLIAARIANGETLRQIAASLNIVVSRLADWLNADAGRTARARDARKLVAEQADEQAEQILLALPADATGAQIAQARELASHYRWRAKAFAPHLYGDKQQIEHTGNLSVSVSKQDSEL